MLPWLVPSTWLFRSSDDCFSFLALDAVVVLPTLRVTGFLRPEKEIYRVSSEGKNDPCYIAKSRKKKKKEKRIVSKIALCTENHHVFRIEAVLIWGIDSGYLDLAQFNWMFYFSLVSY